MGVAISYAGDRARRRADLLSPQILLIMEDMAEWAEERNLPFVVTSTVSTLAEDQVLKRASSTHREGRAFDLSSKGWGPVERQQFIKYFSERYKHVAAVNQDGGPSLIVYHDSGHGMHFHVQVNRAFADYKIPGTLKERGEVL